MNRIEVYDKIRDSRGESVKKNIEEDLTINVGKVLYVDVYLIKGNFSEDQLKAAGEKLLADPVSQGFTKSVKIPPDAWAIEVRYKPGVTDAVAESALKALQDININADAVRTAQKYIIEGVEEESVARICNELLANDVVQDYVYTKHEEGLSDVDEKEPQESSEIATVELIGASDEKLVKISKEGLLSLNLEEMNAVKEYFTKKRRNPTDAELETIAQTWSEHCKHKTLTALIECDGEVIDNLLKQTIKKATKEIGKKKKWLVSVFKDNAGIIEFDHDNHIAFKVETHNHPSALDPYGGAGTGIGGVIRDVLGVGLGAKPIFNTDIFCFAHPDTKKVPEKLLHPKRIFKGVVSGVRDYGNRMGIPTINGAVIFHDNYLGNPLVYCGTAGIMPKGSENKKANPGDMIVCIGGKTGRDGIHGATFSSIELDETTSSSAVQIGDAIQEKKVMDVQLQARDLGIYSCVTDCGAGGFSSAVGEMAEELGCVVHLERAPLKYKGLQPWEIWVSEAQERMVFAVNPKNIDQLKELCEKEDVEMTVFGEFSDDKILKVMYNDKTAIEMDMDFLHNGVPREKRKAVIKKPKCMEPDFEEPTELTGYLKKILSHPTIASKEWVIRQYDHEVQGGSIIKPLTGIEHDGPSDSSVVRPVLGSNRGVIVSNGINPRYGLIDAYHMAASAIDEALRNIVATGCSIEHVALLDNFAWGNPNKEEKLGSLVAASKACYDIATVYETPFISGKDSLNNEYVINGETIAIPDTLLISAFGVMGDVTKAVTMDAKHAGDAVYIVGETFDELGGSYYYESMGYLGLNVPKVDAKKGKKIMEKLAKAMDDEIVKACHDCSEGGIGVAAAEMAFSGNLGMKLNLTKVPTKVKRNDKILFSESNSRFLVEVKDGKAFEKAMKGTVFAKIGEITNEKLKVECLNGYTIVDADIKDLKEAWQGTLKW